MRSPTRMFQRKRPLAWAVGVNNANCTSSRGNQYDVGYDPCQTSCVLRLFATASPLRNTRTQRGLGSVRRISLSSAMATR